MNAAAEFPEGQYAKVEMMGHRTLWGRISEVTVFGAAMLKIEPIVGGNIVGEVLTGAASIYCLTKVSATTAFGMAPSKPEWGNETLQLLAAPTDAIAEEHASDADNIPPPAPPRNPATDVCDCDHFRERHANDGPCGYVGCGCQEFSLEMPF